MSLIFVNVFPSFLFLYFFQEEDVSKFIPEDFLHQQQEQGEEDKEEEDKEEEGEIVQEEEEVEEESADDAATATLVPTFTTQSSTVDQPASSTSDNLVPFSATGGSFPIFIPTVPTRWENTKERKYFF